MPTKRKRNLVWMDLEMTGLSPQDDRIIEIATVVTDPHLNIIEEGPVLAIHQSLTRLARMDEWNTRTHTDSGLVARVRESKIDEEEAQRITLKFIAKHVPGNHSPLCGNSICQDRRFLALYMPKLESYLHYRNLDVSSLKELVMRWRPDLLDVFKKNNTHRALDDIRESIAELKFYRETFIRA
ncbi:MAG: oligoribonuclease [Gammaproteobacteria bacterium]|nr:oligoribonuclease [Gammaproteobacteria bacterium]MDD9821981.1 oligoribonuclease [Gammaproteobacteria bacterium]MDD9855092.1 oligoribonuclease [Gammaproteobacteria bacterium]MDD9885202.1 oligoribonuclease [Gammaproteobacteria bacterium]